MVGNVLSVFRLPPQQKANIPHLLLTTSSLLLPRCFLYGGVDDRALLLREREADEGQGLAVAGELVRVEVRLDLLDRLGNH